MSMPPNVILIVCSPTSLGSYEHSYLTRPFACGWPAPTVAGSAAPLGPRTVTVTSPISGVSTVNAPPSPATHSTSPGPYARQRAALRSASRLRRYSSDSPSALRKYEMYVITDCSSTRGLASSLASRRRGMLSSALASARPRSQFSSFLLTSRLLCSGHDPGAMAFVKAHSARPSFQSFLKPVMPYSGIFDCTHRSSSSLALLSSLRPLFTW
mmetsp:Transcript_27912/g.70000  ORF Transcript_27912/g.70000 Transcript_27912/m.70000 type:complete len:212 (-) Transcript_27912:425-1060(-)